MSANNYQIKPNKIAPKITKELFKKAIDIFTIPSSVYNEMGISLYIINEMNRLKIDYHIDNYSNIIISKGDGDKPCFCAHLDTVHIYKNGFNVFCTTGGDKNRDYLIAEDNNKKRVGIGGDDKNGIFVCLYLLERIDNIKIVFFSQEESGGIGSSNIDLSVFGDCKFIGSVDRWNGGDFINRYSGIDTISKDFKKAISPLLKKYDYSFNSGLFTDSFNVMERDVQLSCFNLSCGYYSHHSDSEYIDLNELYNCCLFCEEIARLPYSFPHKIKNKNKFDYNAWLKWDTKHYNRPYFKDDIYRGAKGDVDTGDSQRYCSCCGLELLEWETGAYCDSCKSYFKDEIDMESYLYDK